MKNDPKLNSIIQYSIEILIRIGFLLLLIAWCFQILYPFSGIILWGVVLALALTPLFRTLNNKLNDKPKRSAVIIVVLGLAIIVVPSWLFFDSLISGIQEIGEGIRNDTLVIPPPPEKAADIPIIGKQLYNFWNLTSVSLEEMLVKYKDEILNIAGNIFSSVVSVSGAIFQLVLSLIIAGALLATEDAGNTAKKFFARLMGDKGDEIGLIAAKTVQNVTKGVLGVAFIQAGIIGLGLLLAGIPYAGLWTLIILVMAILQIPAILSVIPVILYLFSVSSTLGASLWTVYFIAASLSDNILKPILLGKGAPVPMLVIFLGVIGGFMMSGFIGLFTGAIVISLGYKLFIAWINGTDDNNEKSSAVAVEIPVDK